MTKPTTPGKDVTVRRSDAATGRNELLNAVENEHK
ncbi:hypothetical protein BC792_101314 [Sphingobacterium allocomposti]|uniref:Uncharacterized protein n=1 Tax=Sphingobacterium allocomposti TaxID=415956 RepID=A0A5S5DUG4_9SPHI|nr:hypothetical protein BC792_101314 [Sphingobacterium composti Yoo et al. 2007 non Ten et al. 2007]